MGNMLADEIATSVTTKVTDFVAVLPQTSSHTYKKRLEAIGDDRGTLKHLMSFML